MEESLNTQIHLQTTTKTFAPKTTTKKATKETPYPAKTSAQTQKTHSHYACLFQGTLQIYLQARVASIHALPANAETSQVQLRSVEFWVILK